MDSETGREDWDSLVEEDEAIPMSRVRQPDPTRVDVLTLCRRMSRGILCLSPEWQRRSCWDPKRASMLIESILLNFPIPEIFVHERNGRGVADVVDGVQRLTSIRKFMANELRLTGLPHLPQYRGCLFRDLPEEAQSHIEMAPLKIVTFDASISRETVFEIFNRLNTGGKSLNREEISNCIYNGPLNSTLREMCEDPSFKRVIKLTNGGLERMKDRSLALTFAAFHLRGYDCVRNGFGPFFQDFQRQYRHISEEDATALMRAFQHSMSVAHTIFGDHSFLALNDRKEWTRQTSVGVFRVVAPSLARYDKNRLVRNADRIRDAFEHLVRTDPQWLSALRRSTGGTLNVRYTFHTWNTILDNIMATDDVEGSQRSFSADFKSELFAADPTCGICSNRIQSLDDAHVDHIKPFSLGGSTTPDNARLTHAHCNMARGARADGLCPTLRLVS